jgi:hypothetical protein
MQKFDDEIQRRVVVVMQDDLEQAALGVNIGHEISTPDLPA